jgi:hypothetical protein
MAKARLSESDRHRLAMLAAAPGHTLVTISAMDLRKLMNSHSRMEEQELELERFRLFRLRVGFAMSLWPSKRGAPRGRS